MGLHHAVLGNSLFRLHQWPESNATVQSHVEDLRRLCNEDYVHMPRGHLSENDFQSVILKVTNTFLAPGLTIQKIHDIEI